MTAKVFVTLKRTVLDPQGKAVQGALAKLGYPEARDVRAGRYIEINIEAKSKEEAQKRVDAMRAVAGVLRGRVEYRGVASLIYSTDFDAERFSESWTTQGRKMR